MSKPIKNNEKKNRNKKNPTSETSPKDTSADLSENDKPQSAKKPKKLTNISSIGKTKQLSIKLRTTKARTTQSTSLSKSSEPRICGNGKAMPSLAELEQMFGDSDDDSPSASTSSEHCKTPVQQVKTDAPKLNISPSTIKVISNKMLDLISNLPVSTILVNDNQPPLPVVPPKKRKKPEEPYIVGCKDREQIIKKSQVVIGKGDEDYGVDYSNLNQNVEEPSPRKCKRRSIAGSLSNSIFNPKSEEIAAMLRERESNDIHSDGSVDSNKTVTYDCNSLSPLNKPRSFSPLPSTSKDNETILKNDLRFNESLLEDMLTNDNSNSHSDVEVIELPCETVIIDDVDEYPQSNGVTQSNNCIEDLTNDVEEVKYKPPPPPTFDAFEDDMYSSIVIDVDQTYCNDDCEIIDVDDVIAENKNIIDKYKKTSESNTVTHVQPNRSRPSIQGISETVMQNNSGSQTTKTFVNNSNASQSNKNKSIECIVTDFFRIHPSSENATPSNRNTSNETIDLSTKKDLSTWHEDIKNIAKTITEYIQLLIKERSCRQIRNRVVSDTIDLDESTNINNDSVTFIPSTHPESSNNIDLSSNILHRPINVMVNNEPEVNNASNLTPPPPKRKGKSKKSKTIKLPETPPHNQNSTPVRNIGECPICMDNLSNNTVASTICGHIFCMPCIQSALKSSGKKCPTCRKPLRGVGYHQLFL